MQPPRRQLDPSQWDLSRPITVPSDQAEEACEIAPFRYDFNPVTSTLTVVEIPSSVHESLLPLFRKAALSAIPPDGFQLSGDSEITISEYLVKEPDFLLVYDALSETDVDNFKVVVDILYTQDSAERAGLVQSYSKAPVHTLVVIDFEGRKEARWPSPQPADEEENIAHSSSLSDYIRRNLNHRLDVDVDSDLPVILSSDWTFNAISKRWKKTVGDNDILDALMDNIAGPGTEPLRAQLVEEWPAIQIYTYKRCKIGRADSKLMLQRQYRYTTSHRHWQVCDRPFENLLADPPSSEAEFVPSLLSSSSPSSSSSSASLPSLQSQFRDIDPSERIRFCDVAVGELIVRRDGMGSHHLLESDPARIQPEERTDPNRFTPEISQSDFKTTIDIAKVKLAIGRFNKMAKKLGQI